MSNTLLSTCSIARTVIALVVSAATALPPEAEGVEPAQFGPATNFPSGYNTGVMVAADFNRDGRPDIAVTTSAGLNLLLGSGGGTLSAPTNYPYYPYGSGALATGDFNNDGKVDLVEADWYSTRIFLGDGVGNLSMLTNMSGDNNFSVYPAAVAVGDLNGDGKADIAVANEGNSSGRGVTVGFGRGDGFFGAPTNCALPETPGDIALGDLNGDGRLDAAVSLLIYSGSSLKSVCVLTNRGNGTFAISRYYDASIADRHYSLKLVDFNGAGGLDLAVLNYDAQSVTIRLNNGSGIFESATNYPVGFRPTSLAAGDFNGDGKVDLAVRGGTIARVLLGHGDGSFTVGSPMSVASGDISPGTIAIGDFDTNGTPDLALANYNNISVAIILNQTLPILGITPQPGYNQITWLATLGTGFTLEYTTNLLVPGSWQAFPSPPVQIGSQRAVTDWTDCGNKFYRLRKP
jgi:hypothetical protein